MIGGMCLKLTLRFLNASMRSCGGRTKSIERAAVEIIEDYIKKRVEGFKGNDWFPAYGWLAYELGEMFYELMEELRMNVYDSIEPLY